MLYTYIKNFKNLITDDKIESMVISVILGFGISLIAGHVISSPSTSLMLALVFSIITNYLIGKYSNKKDTKMNNLINLYNRKPLYACLLVIALSCFVVPFMYTYDKNNPKFYVSSQNININDIKDINGLNLINSSNYKINNIEDTIYNYKFNENKIKLDINIIDRCFDNDTCVKFLNINNNSDKKIYININLSDSKYDSTFDFKPYERERSISPELGNDYLRLPITYMENKDSSILIGKTYQYKYLDTNDEKVVLKEIIFEDNDLKYIDNSYIKTIRINSNSSIDTYFFTGDKLFNDKKSIEKYIKLINEGKTSPWISYDGTYSKIKKTIFPYSEKSYGKDLIENTENEIVDILNKNNSKLFYDLVTMTNIYFEKYMDKNNQNIWNTNYKDIILKDKYDIDSTYIDINKNIQVGLYYKKLGEYLKDNEIKMKYQNLSKYLVNQYNYGNIISVEDGILFSDYMMDNQNIRTDISLDCQLSIIQYLLTSYYDTYNYKYYSLAKKLLNTIENMNQKWISKNKNIYSTLNVDNSFTVEDRGFDLLMKLIDIQDYLSETSIGKSDVLNDFIKSKIEYIKAYKLEIPKDLKKKLKAGGYIE